MPGLTRAALHGRDALSRGLVNGEGNDYKKLLQPDEKLLMALAAGT